MNKTIFIDIDGVIFKHGGQDATHQWMHQYTVLDGVMAMFAEWEKNGDTIVICTGRRESNRPWLEQQLREAGVLWDHLIMGLPRGCRVMINDAKPDTGVTAVAYTVARNGNLAEEIARCESESH